MDNKTLIEALPKYLDSIQTIFSWGVPVSMIVIWAVLKNKEVVVGGLNFDLSQAFLPVLAVVTGADVAALFNLIQIGSALNALDKTAFNEGVSKLWLHPWVFNPFSFSGTSTLDIVTSSFGYGSLIFAWWICFGCSAALLNYLKHPYRMRLLLVVPLLLGLGSMGAIQRVYNIILIRSSSHGADLMLQFSSSLTTRKCIALLAVLCGTFAFGLLDRYLLSLSGRIRLTRANFAMFAVAGGGSGTILSLSFTKLILQLFLILSAVPWVLTLLTKHYGLALVLGAVLVGVVFAIASIIGFPVGRAVVGRRFVLAGTLANYSLDAATKLIVNAGGRVSDSLSKKTDYVVAGEDPSSTLDKARELGVKVIGEKEMEELISLKSQF